MDRLEMSPGNLESLEGGPEHESQEAYSSGIFAANSHLQGWGDPAPGLAYASEYRQAVIPHR